MMTRERQKYNRRRRHSALNYQRIENRSEAELDEVNLREIIINLKPQRSLSNCLH